MAIVSIHLPLRVVSGSPTALVRSEGVEHEVHKILGWELAWEFYQTANGRRRRRSDRPTGELTVITMCGKDIHALTDLGGWQTKRRPCELCAKAVRERRWQVVIHPAGWGPMQHQYIDGVLEQARRKNKDGQVKRPVVVDDAQMTLPS